MHVLTDIEYTQHFVLLVYLFYAVITWPTKFHEE